MAIIEYQGSLFQYSEVCSSRVRTAQNLADLDFVTRPFTYCVNSIDIIGNLKSR